MPSQKILEAKKQKVEEFSEKLGMAKSIVLSDYRGLTVEEDTNLRRELREAGVEYKVVKNSLTSRAAKNCDMEYLNDFLTGPVSIALSYDDVIKPAKVLWEFSDKNKKLEIKAGVINGKLISIEEVKALAKLPSREVLIATLLGTLNSPITGFVNVLNGNLRGLVVALNAIAEKRAKEE